MRHTPPYVVPEPAVPAVEAEVTIVNRLGMHARPAMAFVDIANGYASEIRIRKGAQVVDGKSIMQVMMLAATKGTKLKIEADGDDAEDAARMLCALVERKFDEE
jgi:phosphocarrier protein